MSLTMSVQISRISIVSFYKIIYLVIVCQVKIKSFTMYLYKLVLQTLNVYQLRINIATFLHVSVKPSFIINQVESCFKSVFEKQQYRLMDSPQDLKGQSMIKLYQSVGCGSLYIFHKFPILK